MSGVVEFTGVSVQYGERVALRAVTTRLETRRIAIIGANGSGKSTFARLLNGLATATSGEVRVDGLDPVRDGKELRRRIGFVMANPDAQIVMPTVREDVAFSLRGRGLQKPEIRRRVDEALAAAGLDAHADAPAHDLSGGQKQLLALTAVLIAEPALVIADEPTALLDLRNARRISRLLIEEMSPRLVLITHDLALAARCEEVLRFADGRLVDRGEPDAVIDRYIRDDEAAPDPA